MSIYICFYQYHKNILNQDEIGNQFDWIKIEKKDKNFE
jgi:hypothetical protein